MFSVLIAVYIKESPVFLAECLNSLVEQTVQVPEIVIVEDGPLTDDLYQVINDFKKRLNIVSCSLEINSGLAAALNYGLSFCSHELIIRLDSDDVALPNRCELQFNYMSANPSIAVSSGSILEMNHDFSRILSSRVLPLDHNDITIFAKSRSPVSHPAVCFRKHAVLSVGGYPEVYPEDHLLWVKLIQSGYIFSNLKDFLVKMRSGDQMLNRRGFRFLKGQVLTFWFMYKTGFISIFKFLHLLFVYTFLRLSPAFIKVFLYKYFR